ncbi:MAG: carboxypeptidase-like regulatory domain-containing protein [Gemmatimonadota bacterium]
MIRRSSAHLGLGAALLLAAAPATSSAQQTVRARIAGQVYDSVGRVPLTGATVRIVRVDNPSIGRTTTTDVFGRFRYDTVPGGSWLATFLHPALDSLRLEPGVVRVEINEPGEVALPLATPSPRTLVLGNCRGPQALDMGVIVGEVRQASDDAPLVDASIEVEWPEWVLQRGRMVTDLRRRVAKADSLGRYTLCGVPTGNTLRGFAWRGADSTGAIEVLTPESGYAVLDFSVAPVERLAIRPDSSTNTAIVTTVRRGRASVRGRVTTADRRPLPNAVVRVIGSGSQVRTNVEGTFAIVDAGAGTQTVEARAIGYQPMRLAVRLSDAAPTNLNFRLLVQRVQLDTVRVQAGRELPVELRGIERRWRTGAGTVMDAGMVRDRSNLFVTDALRGINGVTIRQVGGFGQRVMMRSSNGTECAAGVILDGQALPPSQSASISLDEIVRREDIAAIEVYPRPSMIPAEFTSMTSGCGVVAIWSKRATGGVIPVKPKPATP